MTTEPLSVIRTIDALRDRVRAWRAASLSVGLVPTMGALHDGHAALITQALATCDRVVVSVFVNPTQFGEGEDFDAYPRDEATDQALIQAKGAQVLFAPGADEMYTPGEMTEVRVTHFDTMLEGVCRPGHFTGVATIVAKLLNAAQADHAFFGEKDFQQLQVIRRLAYDLCIATDIHGVPTVREADGLALSSRNAYLTEDERAIAPKLHALLNAVSQDFQSGQDARTLERNAAEALIKAGFGSVDYVAVADAQTLLPLDRFDAGRPARVIAAAWLGRARLIDNVGV